MTDAPDKGHHPFRNFFSIRRGRAGRRLAHRCKTGVKLADTVSGHQLLGTLQGQSLLLFLRWAPGQVPPYHHHLMPVEPEAMGYIAAVIEHAKAEGVLDDKGVPAQSGGKRGGKRRAKKNAEAAE